MIIKKDTLEKLEDKEIITIDAETGLPVKNPSCWKGRARQYSEDEVVAIILPYILEDITISNHKLANLCGIDRRTIGKYRKSELFKNKLAEATNDKLLNLRALALEQLEKILKDPKVSATVKIKACTAILQHSVSVAEVAIKTGIEFTPIDVNTLMKELDNM